MVISLSGWMALPAEILWARCAKTNVAGVSGGAGRKKVIGTIHLDVLPGKQMAIVADLGAGMFTDELARWRREQIEREAGLVSPVLLCASPARFRLSRVLEPFLPKWDVLSPAEIPHLISI